MIIGHSVFAYQRVLEGDQVLPFPFSFKHIRKVLGACAQNAAVDCKDLSVNQEFYIAVLPLLP